MFGEVLEGKDVVKQLEKVGTAGGQPSEKILIKDSGVLDWSPPPLAEEAAAKAAPTAEAAEKAAADANPDLP